VEGLSLGQKRDSSWIRWVVLAVIVIIIAVVAYYTYGWYFNGTKPPIIPLPASAYADSSVNESAVSGSTIASYTVAAAYPRYISIPNLGDSKARVEKIGLTSLNTLAMPKNISDAGWYQDSATPGQGYGQVVIDGYNMGVHRNGIFHGLDLLENGDAIVVTRGDGKTFTYMVQKVITLPIKQANSSGVQQLTQPIDTSNEGLGLIAPAGTWIPRDKVFNQRILVWAVAK
jgi:hypothetical protein